MKVSHSGNKAEKRLFSAGIGAKIYIFCEKLCILNVKIAERKI
jgi:hypothetical protein